MARQPKTALSGAAQRGNAARAQNAPAAESSTPSEDGFDEGVEDAPGPGAEGAAPPSSEPAAEEPEPEVRTRKSAAVETRKEQEAKRKVEVVKPTDDYVRNKKGEIRKDEDGDEMRFAAGFHKGAGFINENGVRFPPGYKFKGGHIGSFGNVILNRCPRCGHQQSVDEAREGRCGNQIAGVERRPCGFDMVAELEGVHPDDL